MKAGALTDTPIRRGLRKTRPATKGKPSEKRIRLSEVENAIDYLESAATAIARVPRSPYAWKWVVISLHGALYGFAISVLTRNNWEMVVSGPKKKLIDFWTAIERCQREGDVAHYMDSKPLVMTADQKASIDYLKKLRNQIEHYVPKTLYVEEHGLVVTALDALEVARSLALDTGSGRLTVEQRRRVDASVRRGKRLLAASQLYKDHVAAVKRLHRRSGGQGQSS